MKILHYLLGVPPVRGGGLVKYALDLAMAEQEMGDEIVLLFPGKNTFFRRRAEIVKSKEITWTVAYEIYNALPIPEKGIKNVEPFVREEDSSLFEDFLNHIKPDIIHIHSLMGISKNFFSIAKALDMRIIYTTHDYFGICPKVNLLYENHACEDQSGDNCSFCCRNIEDTSQMSFSLYKLYIKMMNLKVLRYVLQQEEVVRLLSEVKRQFLDKKRKNDNSVSERNSSEYQFLKDYYAEMFRNVDIFHFNSRQTEKIFRKNLDIKCGQVIDITHKNIKDMRRKKKFEKLLRISYLGTLQEIKGFYLLKEVLDELYIKSKDFVLNVFFTSRQLNDEYIRYHASYNYDELEDVMDKTDLLVVPSICMETFGFVVKEAVCCGVPCLITENVGAKDWMRKFGRVGIVAEATKESLLYFLNRIYNDRSILEDMNNEIMNMEYDFSFDKHVRNIRKLYTRDLGDEVL